MKMLLRPQYLISVMLIGLGGWVAANAQTKVIKEVPARMINSLEGKDLYNQYCAVCHGVDAKGKGPAAEALKKPATDLTQLAARNSGKYPELAVQVSIRGPHGVLEHGTGEMPIWGPIFTQTGSQKDLGDMRVLALVKYIGTLQK
jgi:mono/diheme cytochrome c family protein